jgi:hypothetical protein
MTSELQVLLKRLEQLPLPYGARLAGRVLELSDTFQADYGIAPSAGALAGFLGVLETVPVREYTSLTLTPDGGLYVEWQLDGINRLAIEFCDDGLARFILHHRNPLHPDRTDVLAGSTTSDALFQTTTSPLTTWMKAAA